MLDIFPAYMLLSNCLTWEVMTLKPVIDFDHKNTFRPATHISVPEFIKVSKICTIFRRTLKPEEYVPAEAHNFWEIVRIADGDSRNMVEGKLFNLSPNEVFLYAPFTYHGAISNPSERTLEIFSFVSDSPYLERLANRPITLNDSQHQLFELILQKGSGFMGRYPWVLTKDRELIQPEEGYPHLQALANLIELFLIDLYESESAPQRGNKTAGKNAEIYQDERLTRLTEYLEAHIYDSLTLEQICNEINIGAASLQKLCKKQFGCGPVSYFLSMKIRTAKQMIAGTSKNFSQIAEELGFSSIHYFSNLFKSRTGVSPSAYAKAIRKK